MPSAISSPVLTPSREVARKQCSQKEERRIKLQSSPNIWLSHNFCHFWPPSPNFLFPSPSLNSLQLAANASTLPRHLSEKFPPCLNTVSATVSEAQNSLSHKSDTAPAEMEEQPSPSSPSGLSRSLYISHCKVSESVSSQLNLCGLRSRDHAMGGGTGKEGPYLAAIIEDCACNLCPDPMNRPHSSPPPLRSQSHSRPRAAFLSPCLSLYHFSFLSLSLQPLCKDQETDIHAPA